MGGAEQFRTNPASAPDGFVPFKGNFRSKDFAKLDPINPGGPLDFYNVAANPQDLEILKVKEIKNGRLAMIAMLGVFIQGLATDEGPAANWGKHRRRSGWLQLCHLERYVNRIRALNFLYYY